MVEADPYARGDSATSSYKQCRLEGGARIGVPPFVQARHSFVRSPCMSMWYLDLNPESSQSTMRIMSGFRPLNSALEAAEGHWSL